MQVLVFLLFILITVCAKKDSWVRAIAYTAVRERASERENVRGRERDRVLLMNAHIRMHVFIHHVRINACIHASVHVCVRSTKHPLSVPSTHTQTHETGAAGVE